MLVNRAESHTSGARFVSQPARWPELLRKKTTPQTWLNFTCNFAFDQNPKTLCEPKRSPKKDEFYFDQNNCWNEKIFYADQNDCWKRVTFTFTKTYAEKRKADFENLQSQPWTKPKPRNTANQNHRRPKRNPKTLKPILATRQNQPELMREKKLLPTKMPRTWKPACWKNTDEKLYFEKCHC